MRFFKKESDTYGEYNYNAIEIEKNLDDCIHTYLDHDLMYERFDVIGIDEAQFFDESIVDVVNKLANSGKRVIVAGLDMDYRGKPFGPMPNLLAIAEYVTKVHAVCTKSGKMASYTHRIVKNEDLVLLGDTRRYEALSRREFIKAKKNKQK